MDRLRTKDIKTIMRSCVRQAILNKQNDITYLPVNSDASVNSESSFNKEA